MSQRHRRIVDGKGRSAEAKPIEEGRGRRKPTSVKRKEEALWASKSGPVTVRKIGDSNEQSKR